MKCASFTTRLANAASLNALAILLAVLAGSLPATAALPVDGGDGGDGGGGGGSGSECLGDTTASFSVSPAEITLGESVTLHWAVHPAAGCAGMTQSISGGVGAVSLSGSKVVQPMGPSSWVLQGRKGAGRRDLASASVEMRLPPTVTITSDNQVGLFLQAIDTANTIIQIQNHVNLDLSHLEYRQIKPGVKIIGGRSSTEPGPRLFTTTNPRQLFTIGVSEDADNVRISGVRLEGAEMGSADSDAAPSDGITVYSSVNDRDRQQRDLRLAGLRGGRAGPAGPYQSLQLQRRVGA